MDRAEVVLARAVAVRAVEQPLAPPPEQLLVAEPPREEHLRDLPAALHQVQRPEAPVVLQLVQPAAQLLVALVVAPQELPVELAEQQRALPAEAQLPVRVALLPAAPPEQDLVPVRAAPVLRAPAAVREAAATVPMAVIPAPKQAALLPKDQGAKNQITPVSGRAPRVVVAAVLAALLPALNNF
ncbi:MAG: hypothetical protein AVDCRST_MAG95-862 [uncultured Adhaeribacter sp.]|uniref:Uncharacterized protein n=1 Tax=uncultured Adhaeribacter sp. TaxID=448109 RepID=A0A6J4HLW4_9BACT|nr:MAG: hypothetical protein AVDCRST_MAG95-862 [uncultured Adhaeribacter sp.]